MARYNEILTGRYNRHLTKLFSMKGEAPAPQLSTEIQPGIQLFSGAEERWLQGWNRFAANVQSTAVVAQYAFVMLGGKTNLNTIAVIERIEMTSNAVCGYNIYQDFNQTEFASSWTSNVARLDGRIGNMASHQSLPVTIGNNASPTAGSATALAIAQKNNAAATDAYNFILFDDQELVITPRDNILIQCNVLNTFLGVNVIWRERFLEESER